MKITYRKINLLCAIFIILWLNSGNFDYVADYIPGAVKYGIVILWFFFAIRRYPSFLEKYIYITYPLFFVLGLLLSSSLIGNKAYYNQYFMVFIYITIMLALFVFYYYYGDLKEIKTLLSIFFVDITIVAIHTFIEVLNNPILVRAMSTSAESKADLLGDVIPNGVGGYAFCYQLTFLVICIAYYFNEYKKKEVAKFIIFTGIFLLLFEAQITMALLMFIIIIAILEFVRSNTKHVLWKFTFIIISIVIVLNYRDILEFLIRFANDDLANRLEELLLLGTTNTSNASDMVARYKLYNTSLQTFFTNPIIGSFGSQPFGGHSTFLDLFAVYGILAIIGILGIIRPLTITYKNSRYIKTAKSYLRVTIIAFVIFSLLNVSIGSDLSLVYCLVIPLFFKYMEIKYKGNIKNENNSN